MKVYCLTHRGRPVLGSLAEDRDSCWGRSFDFVGTRLGPQWRTDNWKDWEGSIASAEEHGYEIRVFGLKGGKKARK